MKNLAIIPARSGSKGLKDKNIRLLDGKPLLAYTIEAAMQSEMFDCIHVSSDSEKYIEIAREFGADEPFLRDEMYASDFSTTWDVVKNVIESYRNIGQSFDVVTILQPTSPLRDAQDIKEGFALFKEKKANTVISVCEMEHTPLWSNIIGENLNMKGFIPEEYVGKNRQQLPSYYRMNGAIYILKVEVLETLKDIYNNGCYAYIMAQERSLDIDGLMDFMIAEAFLKQIRIPKDEVGKIHK